jgi:hypothetical protein
VNAIRHRVFVAFGIIAFAAAPFAIAVLGQSGPAAAKSQDTASKPAAAASAPSLGLVLEEVDPAAAGIDFVHQMGGSGEKFVVETMGSGLALFDADGDGDQDVYLLQGAPLPGAKEFDARSRFYANQGNFTFRDATDSSGLANAGYAMGAAVADADNDGDLDVYVSAYGRGHLFANRGNAQFDDVTESSGIVAEGFLASAAFGDLDNDGLADLYVCNYLDFAEVKKNPYCGKHSPGGRAYCSPHAFSGAPDYLYRNEGKLKFKDVSKETGVARAGRFDGKGLGVVLSDLDLDGDLDLVVANDSCANYLYRNDGGWKFEEFAAIAGVAFAQDGHERAGMGIDSGDCDGDLLPEILICNLNTESLSFFHNATKLMFDDHSGVSGLGPPSLPFVAFGCGLVDLDGDGDRDALVVNGHILDNAQLFGDASPYKQRPLLYENVGKARYRLHPRDQAFLKTERVLRGLAFADLDGDGDLDAIATPSSGPPVLLRNKSSPANHRLVLELVGVASNRAAIGARVLWSAGGVRQSAEVRTAFSYLSASALPLSLGLGTADAAENVEIHWPSGQVTRAITLSAERTWRVEEGKAPVNRGALAPR